MARQPRIEYEGAFYHVMSRGDRQEPIFEDARDREMFLATLGEVCARSGWKVYAWVLMDNHYHLVLQTPQANLVQGMKWFQNTYTRRLNTRHRKWGHVFGGRYKAVVVETAEKKDANYLTTLIDYVHLNPARSGLAKPRKGMGLLDYTWSSLAQGYGLPANRRAKWLAVEEGLDLFGWADVAKERRQFLERLEERAQAHAGEVESPHEGLQNTLQRGWYWGSQSFRERLLKLIKRPGKNRNYRSSQQGRAREEKEAEQWLERGRKHFAIKGPLADAGQRERVAIAWALHQRTNQKQSGIAERLGLRTAVNVSQQVRRFNKEHHTAKRSKAVKQWVASVKIC